MRCRCLECINNEDGYCGCYDPIEIDENGECDCLWILTDREDDEND